MNMREVWRRIVRLFLPDEPKKRRGAAIGLAIIAIGLVWGVLWVGIAETLLAVAIVLAVALLLISQARSMGKAVIVVLSVAAIPVAVAATPLPTTVGVGYEGRVELAGVPYASAAWGTDYLTAAHGLRVGGNQVTLDGRQFETARLVVLCSGMAHGIDVMLLRVPTHRNRPVVTWGDTSDLKPGDELRLLPYDLPTVTVRLVHHAFGQWTDRGADEWPAEVAHALVAEVQDPRNARALSGYSGSPWMRNGRVYGLHKGSAKVKPQQGREDEKIVALAEPVARIKNCLERMAYRSP